MKKRVISVCCESTIHHFPVGGLNPMDMTIFFCDKCNKVCKTKVIKEEIVEKQS